MRKFFLLLLLVAVAAIAFYRQRLFLRDPLGKVLVAGVRVKEASVFINYSNDVLVQGGGSSAVIVQGWDRNPGYPQQLRCFRTLACLTSDDRSPKTAFKRSGYNPETVMSDREVDYRDEAGNPVRVVIR